MRRDFALERRVPLALILALMLQAAAAVWWASAKDAQDHFRDQRLLEINQYLSGSSGREEEILQRLARLEAQGEENGAALRRLETHLSKFR